MSCCPSNPPSATSVSSSPAWEAPPASTTPVLSLYNSLTRTKVPFVPMHGNSVVWYMCGPTVYDQTHLGHGRTYTCFDYVRRIMEGYFHYDVTLVMNITDIDDKIILRAAEQGYATAVLAKDPIKAASFQSATKDDQKRDVLTWSATQPPADNMARTVALSQYWETAFLTDMAALDIQLPTVLTRVSEYVPEIITYVETIIANGYAYESNGSVYFNTAAFAASPDKVYGKLVPENVGQSELMAEGEGALASVGASDKKNPNDFALWKKSKAGEPFWSSVWGEGRPGWHIECSVMASDTVKHLAKGKIDIHTGGIDLRFPHHDNELAQCEAYFDFHQWVNYFVHTGHLNIQGLKMSKSLKNFVKIQEALVTHSPRQLRFLFLLHKYNTPMDYNDNTMAEAVVMEKAFSAFFANMKVVLRALPLTGLQKWSEREKTLQQRLITIQASVHAALCDDLNTPGVLALLLELTKDVNRYVAASHAASPTISLVVASIVTWMTSIFQIFGCGRNDAPLGFPVTGSGEASTQDHEAHVAPLLDTLCAFRDAVRRSAKASTSSFASSQLLTLCDDLRDVSLVDCGVKLEDREADKCIWKLASPESLRAEMAAAAAEKQAKLDKAAAAANDARDKAAALTLLAAIPPEAFFKTTQREKFSQFDDLGFPTHDALGEPLSKAAGKKLKKELEKHVKLVAKHQTGL